VTSLSDPYLLGTLAYRLLAGPPEPRRAATADEVGAVHAPSGISSRTPTDRPDGSCGGGRGTPARREITQRM
jgi:hypothetical protein